MASAKPRKDEKTTRHGETVKWCSLSRKQNARVGGGYARTEGGARVGIHANVCGDLQNCSANCEAAGRRNLARCVPRKMRDRKRASVEISESQDEDRNGVGISADYS